MSTRLASEEIRRFLASETPEVLCLTGKWGVGKTYAWEKALQTASQSGSLRLSSYSYVSLFGQGSLDSVRYSLFENTVPAKDAAKVPDLKTLESSFSTLTGGSRGALKFFNTVPKLGPYVSALGQAAFLLVRSQIVCFDDLERLGKGLDLRDILGLASYLKEKRRCKVVLLLNEEALQGKAGEDFRAQLEKVADTSVSFEPTSQEAAEIAFSNGTMAAQLKQFAITLGIINIRVLSKMKVSAARLAEICNGYDERLLKQALHTMVLYTYAKYQPDVAPSLEFLDGFARYEGLFGRNRNEKEPEPQASWRRLLSDYEFGSRDDLDAAVIAGVKRGAFDRSEFEEPLRARAKQLALNDRDASFSKAWDAYHDSFDLNDAQVLDDMYQAFCSSIAAISLVNANGTIRLFREMGRDAQADELILAYINGHEAGRKFWSLRDGPFSGDVTDPSFREAVHHKFLSFAAPTTAAETLVRVGANSGWNPEDTEQLASLSEDEIYGILKSLRGDDLRHAVSAVTRFEGIGAASSDARVIATNGLKALARIASESPMNARRASQKAGRRLPPADTAGSSEEGAAEVLASSSSGDLS